MKKVIAVVMTLVIVMSMAVSAYADTYDWKSEPLGFTVAKLVAREFDLALQEEGLKPEDYSVTVEDSSTGGYQVAVDIDYYAAIGANIDTSGNDINKMIFAIDEYGENYYMIYYSDGTIVDTDYGWYDAEDVVEGF